METYVESTILPISIIIQLPLVVGGGAYLVYRYIKSKNAFNITAIMMLLLTWLIRAASSMQTSTAYKVLKSCGIAELLLLVLTILLIIKAFQKAKKDINEQKEAIQKVNTEEGDFNIENQNS